MFPLQMLISLLFSWSKREKLPRCSRAGRMTTLQSLKKVKNEDLPPNWYSQLHSYISPTHTDFHIVAIMMFTNLSHNSISLLLKILQQFPISIQSKIQSSYYGLQGLLAAPATSLTSSPLLPFPPAYHPPNSVASQMISKRPVVHSGVCT